METTQATNLPATIRTPRPVGNLTDRGIANVFLLPTFLLLVAINVFPLVWSLYLSFCSYNGTSSHPAVWVGGANYTTLLADPAVNERFWLTARFTLFAVGAQMLIGFGLALLLNRTFRIKGMVTTLLLLPMMLSPVVVGLFWRFMFEPSKGLVNYLLQTAHLQDPANPVNWLNDRTYALYALVITDTWMWSPFVMLIALAGLSAVPPHLYEAAEVDRASGWFKFRHITIPMIAPLLMVALLFRTMDCFKLFDLIYVLTKGGPGRTTETVSYNLYNRAFSFHDTGQACALAYIILLIIIGLANLYIKLLARIRGEGINDDTPLLGDLPERLAHVPILGWLLESPARIVGVLAALTLWPYALGTLPWLAAHVLPLLILVAGLVVVVKLPQRGRTLLAYVTIALTLGLYLLPIFWIGATSVKSPQDINALTPKFAFAPTLENYDSLIYQRQGNSSDGKVTGLTSFPGQLGNSLFIGGLSTILAVALGTMAAYALARFPIKGKGDLLFFILSTRMLPAIAVVIPIFLMFQKLGLLGTHLGLILLYTVFNLSFSTYLMKGFFDEIPHEYDDAALLDGYSRFAAFRKVSLPQATTGMAATAVFCFITAWNEFAFAQILAPAQPLTAPPSIIARTGSGGVDWGPIAAGTLLYLIPAAIFTFLMRKHLLRGVTFGAIKR